MHTSASSRMPLTINAQSASPAFAVAVVSVMHYACHAARCTNMRPPNLHLHSTLPAGNTLALGHVFRSTAFTILGALVSGWQITVWLFVACMTAYHGWAGNLFHPPCLSVPASPADQPL